MADSIRHCPSINMDDVLDLRCVVWYRGHVPHQRPVCVWRPDSEARVCMFCRLPGRWPGLYTSRSVKPHQYLHSNLKGMVCYIGLGWFRYCSDCRVVTNKKCHNPTDECSSVSDCDANAQCQYDGSSHRYRCVCNIGFMGDGRSCTPVRGQVWSWSYGWHNCDLWSNVNMVKCKQCNEWHVLTMGSCGVCTAVSITPAIASSMNFLIVGLG